MSATARNGKRTRNPAIFDSQFKRIGARVVGRHLDAKQLSQTEAAYIMHDAASQISLVVCGKLKGFSEGRINRMLNRLGYDTVTTIRPAKGKTGKTTIIDESGT